MSLGNVHCINNLICKGKQMSHTKFTEDVILVELFVNNLFIFIILKKIFSSLLGSNDSLDVQLPLKIYVPKSVSSHNYTKRCPVITHIVCKKYHKPKFAML